ncbi:hypothetical protein BDN72DRAFT_562474 [Pluteus cervinus]|uniref:Uncharacterized protein n=1 Tax=Pluteus cervinus TaxID=181527 RepID=A0ACD3BC32_9AGAR|nr:hypothetical protein BDN72DRAFT_562474 [Pluteus cervinus]
MSIALALTVPLASLVPSDDDRERILAELLIMATNSFTLISVFNAFSILGIVLTLATLAPVLFFGVHRRPAWISQMLLWLVYSTSYFLLFGRQVGNAPPWGLCAFQAALIYASPASCSFGVTCFMIDFYIEWRSTLTGRKTPARVVYVVAAIPIFVHVFVFCLTLLLISEPAAVQREEIGFYCHTTDGVASAIATFIVLGAALFLFPLEIYTGVLVYRHQNAYRHLCPKTSRSFLSMYIRMILLSISSAFGFGLGVFIIPHITSSVDPTWSALLPTRMPYAHSENYLTECIKSLFSLPLHLELNATFLPHMRFGKEPLQ